MSEKPIQVHLRVLDFMKGFHEREDRLPTMDEIKEHFEWRSQNSAHCHLMRLERKGLIEKRGSHYRFARAALANTERKTS